MREARETVREISDQPSEQTLGDDVQYRLYHFEVLRPRTERATEGEHLERAQVDRRVVEWLQK